MRKKLPHPVPLSDILTTTVRHWKPEPKALLGALQHHWEQIVGKNLARQTHPLWVHQGLLLIGVDNPAWANELQMMQEMIVKKIDEEVPAAEIRRIRFQTVSRLSRFDPVKDQS